MKARNLAMMRWLIIDEISQVGAELLIQCEANIRVGTQTTRTHYKVDRSTGKMRPWVVLNVIYVGDFLQLPPTRATPLFTLSSSLLNLAGLTNARVQQGLNLFWHDTTHIVTLTK